MVGNTYNDLIDSIIYAKNLLSINSNNGRTLLKRIINNNISRKEINLALDFLWEDYNKRYQLIDFKSYINNLSNSTGNFDFLGCSKIIGSKFNNENLIDELDQIIASYGISPVSLFALYEKFVYYYFTEDSYNDSYSIYILVKLNYGLNEYTADMSVILFGPGTLKNENKSNKISTETKSYQIFQNYPNPFNPSTVILYSVKDAGLVSLKVFDILGREVALLVNDIKEAGNHSVEFNASNLPSGVYIYNLQVNGYTNSKKMLLLK